MSHPYSGSASYIYANDYVDPYPRYDQDPYSHMRSVIPMHSLINVQEPWPQEDPNRISGVTDQRVSNWGSEGGMLSSESPRRNWKTRANVWRENIKSRVKRALKNLKNIFTFRFPPWIVPARPALSTVQPGSLDTDIYPIPLSRNYNERY
ncbi:hypothetical protein BDZ94DRAFT_1261887 [Collybia nuda]|uniref:Uncharacterized protein n=1 Tax=Collybia nuda TaxID=64659 RepID=A0A9P5Y6M4_9AGAR|nr:hypothetical protein BDZ94DRAFT_1261887 [Collybia nuda]